MTSSCSPLLLPDAPQIDSRLQRQIADDYERFAATGPPGNLDQYVLENFGIDSVTTYAGHPIRNPWGKASGQLSMTPHQVADDVAAGLGFVVLKTVIAQDESGRRSMEAWATRETRMLAEPIVGRSGQTGWTISWKGRGWWQSFDDYLALVRRAREIAAGRGTLILPSCKFHLPGPDENEWRVSEYHWTTARLLEAWSRADDLPDTRMPLEKDFSPTLAGSDRALIQARILDWLRTVPALIRGEAASPDERGRPVCVGLKLFNALFDDAFQVAMLEAIHDAGASRPDYFIYGNRLFDPQREFDGHRGIACGGPDLSDRNLRVLDRFRESVRASNIVAPCLPRSATGNITTGRMALEYALRGASSFQLHTYFQLPAEQYRMIAGTRAQKALHELYFHPQTGWIAWMHHLAHVLALSRTPLRFQDAVGRADDVAIERSRQANSS